ncbi:reverse transcriptase domain-containing protein [Tanacetum coccineum]
MCLVLRSQSRHRFHQKEDLKDDPKVDPADYPADGGDTKEEKESSKDDADEEDEEEASEEEDDDEEEEDHLALFKSSVVPIDDPVPSVEETKPFETNKSAPTPPSPKLHEARISVQPQTPMAAATEALITAVAAALPSSSPPPSPLTLLSSPLPQIPSPPLPLPAPSSPLLLLATKRREDVLEANVLPQKRGWLWDYGFWDDMVGDMEERAPTTLEELSQRVTNLLGILIRYRRYHFHTAMLLESEARHAQQTWSQAMDYNKAVHAELLAYRAEKMAPKRNTSTTPMTVVAIKALIAQGVATALAEHEANRSRNRDDSHDSGSGGRRQVPNACECTYIRKQVKYATCTLLGNALTWWNSHIKTIGHDAAYGMMWKTLMKMMTNKYYPRGEIKKLEIEIWNLKVKGTDVVSYTQRFQELDLLCGMMFPEVSYEVEKYVGGLPDMIQGSVMASKPKTMQEAIEIANDLMDQKVRTFANRQAENKRKLDDNSRNN